MTNKLNHDAVIRSYQANRKARKEQELSSVTRVELAHLLEVKYGLTSKQAYNFVSLFFNEIANMLRVGKPVRLSGFGTFEVVEKKARMGRNLQTGEQITISPRRVVKFRPSKSSRIEEGEYGWKL